MVLESLENPQGEPGISASLRWLASVIGMEVFRDMVQVNGTHCIAGRSNDGIWSYSPANRSGSQRAAVDQYSWTRYVCPTPSYGQVRFRICIAFGSVNFLWLVDVLDLLRVHFTAYVLVFLVRRPRIQGKSTGLHIYRYTCLWFSVPQFLSGTYIG